LSSGSETSISVARRDAVAAVVNVVR
jgi:hypothetical protein